MKQMGSIEKDRYICYSLSKERWAMKTLIFVAMVLTLTFSTGYAYGQEGDHSGGGQDMGGAPQGVSGQDASGYGPGKQAVRSSGRGAQNVSMMQSGPVTVSPSSKANKEKKSDE